MPEFAKRMDYMAGSAAIIRGLFGAMNDPETISFGGGAPATEALPAETIRKIAACSHPTSAAGKRCSTAPSRASDSCARSSRKSS